MINRLYKLLRATLFVLYGVIAVWLAWLLLAGRLAPIDGDQVALIAPIVIAGVLTCLALRWARFRRPLVEYPAVLGNLLFFLFMGAIVATNPVRLESALEWFLLTVTSAVPILAVAALVVQSDRSKTKIA